MRWLKIITVGGYCYWTENLQQAIKFSSIDKVTKYNNPSFKMCEGIHGHIEIRKPYKIQQMLFTLKYIDPYQNQDDEEQDDEYLRDASQYYWVEEDEMKLGIHPSQILKRVQNSLNKLNIAYKEITYMDYRQSTLVDIYLDNKLYKTYDYTKNTFVESDDIQTEKRNYQCKNLTDGIKIQLDDSTVEELKNYASTNNLTTSEAIKHAITMMISKNTR